MKDFKNDCKYFKQHFIYSPKRQKFSNIDCGHCLRSSNRSSCEHCKFYTPENKTEFVDMSMINKMHEILKVSHEIIDLINQKNSE